MSTLSVSLPDTLFKQAERLAEHEGISMDRFIMTAIEKMASDYLENRAQRGNREAYEAALASAPDIEPEDYDKLPE
jgi:metal-responsive CopG/Arc/MetJ family transcriptional regulator